MDGELMDWKSRARDLFRENGALRNQLTGTQDELRAAQAVIAEVHEAQRENAFNGETFYSTWHVDRALESRPHVVLDAALEDAKRVAWDEGLLVGQDPYGFDTTNNPYRKAE